MRNIVVCILVFFFSIYIGHCQVAVVKESKFWIDAGPGAYNSGHTSGFTLYLGANLVFDSTQYKLRTLLHDEFLLFGPSPSEKYYSVGALIGKGIYTRFIQIQVSAGLGVTGGITRGDLLYTEPIGGGWFDFSDRRRFEEKRFFTPSIPIEIDLLITPFKFVGVGFSLFGELNPKRPLYGAALKLGIGKF